MFIEPHRSEKRKGWIEVICGSMFSGKTEELIRRLKRAQIANQPVAIFKPAIDKRYDELHIVSHDAAKVPSTAVSKAAAILSLATDAAVVAIDEAQFFDDSLVATVDALTENGKRVIVAGLDMDYLGNPFGPMPSLLAKAEYITKLHAICVQCGDIANFSYRRTQEENQIVLGEKETYEPRCRHCFYTKN
jgi:thymidine kinase